MEQVLSGALMLLPGEIGNQSSGAIDMHINFDIVLLLNSIRETGILFLFVL